MIAKSNFSRALERSVFVALSVFPFAFSLQVIHAYAADQEVCIYTDRQKRVNQVNSLDQVPPDFRQSAKCFSNASRREYMAKPQDIQLDGSTRREDLNSAVGTIHLRWPRKVEALFGRNPLRAMTDAAATVSKSLNRSSFPGELQKLNLEWQVVFMDADLPETQIPSYLIQNCHPGWMTPPANIYIVAQRVAGRCTPGDHISSVADEQLTRVLVHEMGHAVEFYLLKGTNSSDRMRAEGFAAWFEKFAADYSSILSKSKIVQEQKTRAIVALRQSPRGFQFSGSAEDYARASMYFSVLEEKRSLKTLMDIYTRMVSSNVDFFTAVNQETGWDVRKLDSEVAKFLGAK